MWRSLRCPSAPRDRGMDGAQQLQHIGQAQGDQRGTWPWPCVQHRQGHRACAAQRVGRWLSLSGQDCSEVRALFWCGGRGHLAAHGWGVHGPMGC